MKGTEQSTIGYKQSRYIVAHHYSVDPLTAVRKLVQLFKHSGNKRDAIIAEATRIVGLRDKHGIDAMQCELCGRLDHPSNVFPREECTLKIPNRLIRNGWKSWCIESPTLCKLCWADAVHVIYQYKQLLDLNGLCSKLSRARDDYAHNC